jgi:hypothetical protein
VYDDSLLFIKPMTKPGVVLAGQTVCAGLDDSMPIDEDYINLEPT